MNYLKKVVIVLLCLSFKVNTHAQQHPNIMLTKANIDAVRKGTETYPLLKESYSDIKQQADIALTQAISVPLPADGGGGVTHEQHKKNYNNILNCAVAYQISGDVKYANYVKDMLLNYASQYKKWPLHPKAKQNHQGGKIFWQALNDCVWQVYVIQGYDMVYDAISSKDRSTIENQLFVPILKFLTEDCYTTFNKIHNHGTWNVAAVGMTGYVLNKPNYVEMALKGSKKDGKSGYLAQINQLFSPDGYYMEGPYYQRYALLPFVLFAKAINNYQPNLKIFDYRDKLLVKAINTSLQLTYTDGTFFPINDAIKDKTYETIELVYGLDLAYADIKAEPFLLDIAQRQKKVIVSDAGLAVAKAISEGKSQPFNYVSQWIKDGGKGDEGGLGIIRSGSNEDQQCLLMKAASQGMGHGHFDRLNILYYDNNTEIFFDYGASRFINIESKRGGHYLPENDSWAKQTVAHNTVVVDQKSQYQAKVSEAEKHSPNLIYFGKNNQMQIVSAEETNAYDGVNLLRTSALVKLPHTKKELLLDVFFVNSNEEHQYDLPFWYKGHLIDASFKPKVFTAELKPLGQEYGYQHIWLNAENKLDTRSGYISILNNKRFYTTHFTSESPLTVKMLSIGANDPEMSLIADKSFMLSQPKAKTQTFVTVTETHGNIDPINETVDAAFSKLSDLKLLNSNKNGAEVSFKYAGKSYTYKINYTDQKRFTELVENGN
ncbi:Heparinase II/III family protein [Pseudopedobacter saltans DSM 12145]|uniref:Heparinase II/III family protein n=1 Tax=Pseudopedobacter saltans (strain ATCC 51119 / DSM 12145 / JCM 21818 / CCUG 39354 / LMG 10337 / NBRC 100064 / NCIMB 13643) TaxID=762903 RepID=F0SD07_PSESL|nr:heparinase II/III family protein [Pseudopedobacter saltans]ADY51764.1 Heparinase II/III family protein [Pseudopedobacter saltans DSM 12145]